MSKDDALTKVEGAARMVATFQRELDQFILLARDEGASWAELGNALGVPRSSAQQRWQSARRRAERDES